MRLRGIDHQTASKMSVLQKKKKKDPSSTEPNQCEPVKINSCLTHSDTLRRGLNNNRTTVQLTHCGLVAQGIAVKTPQKDKREWSKACHVRKRFRGREWCTIDQEKTKENKTMEEFQVEFQQEAPPVPLLHWIAASSSSSQASQAGDG